MDFICQECNALFQADDKRRKYCSVDCYHTKARRNPNRTAFTKGSTPWNKGVKGLRLSPATEFKKGQKGRNWLPVGTCRVRRDKNGKQRRFIKIKEPSIWQSYPVYVWEQHHGKLAKNSIIHHKDRDTLNDDIANLQALTRAEHLKEHRPEFESQRRDALRKKSLSRKAIS